MGRGRDLLDAARNGNMALVCKLLDLTKQNSPLSSFRRSPPSVNGQDVNGYTPLHHACLNGHTDIVRLLLAHEAMSDLRDIRGSTPLFLASWAGHHDIVKMLLMHPKPANPNSQTIDNETPLHCAAQHGHNVALAVLLAYGADPSIRNNSFQTALDLAAQFGRLQAVQILIWTHPSLIEPFRTGDVSEAQNSYKPTSLTKHIFTHSCLHLASRNGHKKVVETLLVAGVDVNILTHAGTALHEAALCGKKSVAYTLLQAGINCDAVDGNGRTASDILKDFPPHVTYGMVSIINDFYKKNGSETHFKPITSPGNIDENDNRLNFSSSDHNQNHMRDKSHSMPKSVYEKKQQGIDSNKPLLKVLTTEDLKPKIFKSTGLSISMSSLEQSKPAAASYLKMKPILWQKSTTDIISPPKAIHLTYKPVYKQPCITLFNDSGDKGTCEGFKAAAVISCKTPPKTYEAKSGSGSEGNSSSSNHEIPITRRYRCVDEYVEMSEPYATRKKPQPSPRSKIQFKDYANVNSMSKDQDRGSSPTSTRSIDNNKNNTPPFPPPSVNIAEHTILEFMQPLSKKNKRKSIRFPKLENCEFENVENELNLEDSLSSSRASDCVEEFVGENPFAGLFKGSTLNLATEFDEVDGDGVSPLDQPSLRSPSLVKSVRPPPVPAKRNASLTKNTNSTDEVWEEINNILESIGNDVLDVKLYSLNNQDSRLHSLKMRDPIDLLLGNWGNKPEEAKWCHSANTLIYGEIRFFVFYLGSTVIRKLHGNASTRKSIQKLKLNEITIEQEANLLEDCSSSTKYLKANNHQSRKQVGIAVSREGVRYINIDENKSTICIHNIENINCVCQDTEDLRYFAYITKESTMHYCHVFMVDSLELAKEIILTLAQAFEVAYQLSLNNPPISQLEDD